MLLEVEEAEQMKKAPQSIHQMFVFFGKQPQQNFLVSCGME